MLLPINPAPPVMMYIGLFPLFSLLSTVVMLIIVVMVVRMIVVRVVMVLVLVMVTMTGVGSANHIHGLFQNPVRHLHAADRLIKQIRHFSVSFFPCEFCPFPEILTVMIVVLHPMGQEYS
jgi:hypothetical protein